MKKNVVCLFALFLALVYMSACGAEAAAAPDMKALYDDMASSDAMPEMLEISAEQAYMLYGIEASDCRQSVVAICADSLCADEIWLIEASDSAAAERVAELAQTRLDQKGEELKSYLPEQYKIVQAAKLIKSGNCVAMIVSPDAAELAESFNSAFTK